MAQDKYKQLIARLHSLRTTDKHFASVRTAADNIRAFRTVFPLAVEQFLLKKIENVPSENWAETCSGIARRHRNNGIVHINISWVGTIVEEWNQSQKDDHTKIKIIENSTASRVGKATRKAPKEKPEGHLPKAKFKIESLPEAGSVTAGSKTREDIYAEHRVTWVISERIMMLMVDNMPEPEQYTFSHNKKPYFTPKGAELAQHLALCIQSPKDAHELEKTFLRRTQLNQGINLDALKAIMEQVTSLALSSAKR